MRLLTADPLGKAVLMISSIYQNWWYSDRLIVMYDEIRAALDTSTTQEQIMYFATGNKMKRRFREL